MIAFERRAKLVLGSIAGAAALHLVLAACGHSTTNSAQCQQGNCTSGSGSNGPGFVPPGAVMAYGGAASGPGGNEGDAVGSLEGDAQAAGAYTSGYAGAVNAGFNDCSSSMIHPSGTGISIQGSGTNVSIQAGATGISLATSGGSETRPTNASVVWIIKS